MRYNVSAGDFGKDRSPVLSRYQHGFVIAAFLLVDFGNRRFDAGKGGNPVAESIDVERGVTLLQLIFFVHQKTAVAVLE